MVKKQDDDISIDFSMLTNIFKSKNRNSKINGKRKLNHKKNDYNVKNNEKSEMGVNDDISFDFSNFSLLKKYGLFLLILIPVIFSIYFRLGSVYLPVTEEWATGTVHNYYKNLIGQQISQQYPTLPATNKNILIDKQFNEYLEANEAKVNSEIKQSAEYFKSRLQDEKGLTYLIAIDSYFWLSKTENVINHGFMGDEIKNGIEWDSRMLAPLGRNEIKGEGQFHVYFQAYLYKFMKLFDKDSYPRKAAFYTPVIIMAIAAFFAFLVGRQLSGNLGGVVTGIIVGIHPSILGRTPAGFSDTDAYNIMFPILIVWALYSAFTAKETKYKYIFSGIAGLFSGIFAFSWVGWWFVFDFCLLAIGGYILFYILVNKNLISDSSKLIKDNKVLTTLIITVIFIISMIIFSAIFTGSNNAGLMPFKGPTSFMKIKDVGLSTVWPNVYLTVAELNEVTSSQIIDNSGKMLIFLMLCGLVLLLLNNFYFNKDKDKNYTNMFFFFLIIIWFIGTFYSATKGVRFVMLMIPAIALGVGAFAGFSYNLLIKFLTKELEIPKIIASIILVVMLVIPIFLFPMNLVTAAQTISKNQIPSFNDAWYNSLTKIRDNSAPDAIINSWWDFGHWFKYWGNRSVTFDGASQNTPIAHWIGLTLLSSDEDLSMGLLRMLDCGSNNAFETINKEIKVDYKSVDIIYEIVLLEKEEAKEKLISYGISDPESVLQWTHCKPPENYLIASGDMIGKSGVWAHFGSWDFKKATIVNNVKNNPRNRSIPDLISYIQNEFGYDKDMAESIYYEVRALGGGRDSANWISSWPSYASGRTACNIVNSSIVQCGNGAEINLKKMEAVFMTQQGKVRAKSFSYIDNEGFHIIDQGEDTQPYSVILIPTESGYDSILSSPELAGSLFTRLYFFEAHGLEHFKFFNHERAINGDEIFVYNVSWDDRKMNMMSAWKKKVELSQEVRASHILVNSSEDAQEILESLKLGIDFNEIAKEKSIDIASGLNGGDLGFFSKGVMIPDFEEVAFNLEIGEISDIVETQFGYHIILLTDKRNMISENTLLKV